MYFRATTPKAEPTSRDEEKLESPEKHEGLERITTVATADIPPRKSFVQTLRLWGTIDKDSEFFMMMVRSFSYFFVPPVFWVITTYGEYTSFPIKMRSLTFT